VHYHERGFKKKETAKTYQVGAMNKEKYINFVTWKERGR
jgi:hypothetical protein